MAFLVDIMDRLTTHVRAALSLDGGPVTKGGAFYRELLGGLSEDERRQVISHCDHHGCEARFGEGSTGGVTLTLSRQC